MLMFKGRHALAVAVVAGALAPAAAQGTLSRLPAPAPGQPLFDRRMDGHLQVGLTERGRDGGVASPNQEAGIVRGMGGTMMRVPISWVKEQPAAAQYDWAPSDDMDAALVARDIRPIFHVSHTPPWVVAPCGSSTTECNQPPSTPAAQNAYAQFLAAVAQRYPLAAAVEVWNEPNNSQGSVVRPDPVAYAQLLAASYAAVKASNPAMRVLGGSLGAYGAGLGQQTTSVNMRLDDFLAAMEDNGAASNMDGLSFHPYPESSSPNPGNTFYRAFSALAAVLDAKGDGARRLVPDEIGITSNSITEESAQSSTLQARYHDLDVPASSDVHKAAQVDAVIFHTDVNNVANDKYGWVEPLSLNLGFRPHAVWCAFGQMLAGLSGCPARITP